MPKKKTLKLEETADAEAQVREDIGSRIREMRRKLHLSAADVAKELGLSREAVTHIETGRNNIASVALWKLAVRFGCDIQDFFPRVPDGFSFTKVDIAKVDQEGGEKAVEWAKKFFKKA